MTFRVDEGETEHLSHDSGGLKIAPPPPGGEGCGGQALSQTGYPTLSTRYRCHLGWGRSFRWTWELCPGPQLISDRFTLGVVFFPRGGERRGYYDCGVYRQVECNRRSSHCHQIQASQAPRASTSRGPGAWCALFMRVFGPSPGHQVIACTWRRW